jgi:hypothetical protein
MSCHEGGGVGRRTGAGASPGRGEGRQDTTTSMNSATVFFIEAPEIVRSASCVVL